MRSMLLLLPLELTACLNEKGTSDTALNPDCDEPAVEHSSAYPNYDLQPGNFAWQELPILPAVDMNAESFLTYGYLGLEDVVADFTTMASTWSTTGARLEIRAGDTYSTGLGVAGDHQFEVVMVNMNSYDDGDTEEALATTTVAGPGSCATTCDTVVFALDKNHDRFDYVANSAADSGEFSLLTVLVHELGHCVGLDDQTTFTGNTIMDEADPGEDFTSLPSADLDMVQYLYWIP